MNAQQEYLQRLIAHPDNASLIYDINTLSSFDPESQGVTPEQAEVAGQYFQDVLRVKGAATNFRYSNGLDDLNLALHSGGIGIYAADFAASTYETLSRSGMTREDLEAHNIEVYDDVLVASEDPNEVDAGVRYVMANEYGNIFRDAIQVSEHHAFVSGFTFAATNTEQLSALASLDTRWDQNGDGSVQPAERQAALDAVHNVIQTLSDDQKLRIGNVEMSINEARVLADKALDDHVDQDLSQQQAMVAGTLMALAEMRDNPEIQYAGVALQDDVRLVNMPLGGGSSQAAGRE